MANLAQVFGMRKIKCSQTIAQYEKEVADLKSYPEASPLRRQLLPQYDGITADFRRFMEVKGLRPSDRYYHSAFLQYLET